MTTYPNNDECVITIERPADDCKERMIKAIAAATRWYATAEGKYINDDDMLHELAVLLENIVSSKE